MRTGFEVKARSLESSIHVEENHVFGPLCNRLCKATSSHALARKPLCAEILRNTGRWFSSKVYLLAVSQEAANVLL